MANDSAQRALEHCPRGLHGAPRRETGLQICPQREAHERGVGQRLASVSGDVADDDGEPAVVEREQVVEVPARSRPVGGLVGRRGRHRAEPSGRYGKQRGLKQPHVLEQLPALTVQPPHAQRDQARAYAQREREREQHADEDAYGGGHDADDLGDGRHERLQPAGGRRSSARASSRTGAAGRGGDRGSGGELARRGGAGRGTLLRSAAPARVASAAREVGEREAA